MTDSVFFTELRRRRVLPVAGAYIAIKKWGLAPVFRQAFVESPLDTREVFPPPYSDGLISNACIMPKSSWVSMWQCVIILPV